MSNGKTFSIPLNNSELEFEIKIQLKEVVSSIERLENLILKTYLKDSNKYENESIYKKNSKNFLNIGSAQSEIEFAVHRILNFK